MADESSRLDQIAGVAGTLAGTAVRLVQDGTVYCIRKSGGAIKSLTSSGEETTKIEPSKSNEISALSQTKAALTAVGSTTYRWAGTGASLARDGTVYCYQKSKSAIKGLTSSEDKSDKVFVDDSKVGHEFVSPSWARLAGTTVAIVGAGTTSYLWLGAISSRVAKEALRAGCIRNSLCAMSTLSLPIQRSTAVWIGVNLNNYIVQGIVPGLFTAWAVYDTYRLGRWAYNRYYYPNLVQAEIDNYVIGFNKIAA